MSTFTTGKMKFPKSDIPWMDAEIIRSLIMGNYVSDHRIRQASPILRPTIRALAKLPTFEQRCAYLDGYAAGSLIGQSIVKAILRHGPIKTPGMSPSRKIV